VKVLGISCGRRNSNTEIMVKAALMGAEEADAEVMFARLQDYSIKPCTGCNSCVKDLLDNGGRGKCVLRDDDFPHIEQLIMESDGLVLGSPIYEKTPTGHFKVLQDRMGPSHDPAMRLTAKKVRLEKGLTNGEGPDERSFKRRAASLIAVGGSEWDQMALPILGITCLSMQIDVVDQIRVNWVSLPRAIALYDNHLDRARRSGRKVAEALQNPDKPIEYLGDPGACPVCHSKLIEIRHEGQTYPCICGVCGVSGTLSVENGRVSFSVSEDDWRLSHVLMSGKLNHARELDEICLRPPAGYEAIAEKAVKYREYLTPIKPPRLKASSGDDATDGQE
jgi:multimeric flavodoxin WrbA